MTPQTIDFDDPDVAEQLYRLLVARKEGRSHSCERCGARYGFDNINMCKRCGDTYCYECVGRPGERFCACGGEID